MRRRIQHPVKYLKLVVRCLTGIRIMGKKLLSKTFVPQHISTPRPIFMEALMVKWNFTVKTPTVPYLSFLNVLISKREIN